MTEQFTPSLPTEVHIPETGFPKHASWLIFGAPKIGKTGLSDEWPGNLLVELEPKGERYVKHSMVVGPSDSTFPINNLTDLRALGKMLLAEYNKGNRPYETISLDTIDVINSWSEREALKKLKLKDMGDGEYGKDWSEARDITLNIIRAFSMLPVNLLILAHSKWAIVNDIAVGHTIDLPGKLSRFAQAAIENIVYITTDKRGNRKMIFKPVDSIDAGSRNPLLSRIGECPYGYAELVKLFEEQTS